MLLGDLHLLAFGVTREAQDFQAVLQRTGNRVEHVRGRDKEDFGEVVIDIQVMIVERVVLLGVEDFEQRRRRVAAVIRAELIDFV